MIEQDYAGPLQDHELVGVANAAEEKHFSYFAMIQVV